MRVHGVWACVLGVLAIVATGCHSVVPETSPGPYDGDWVLSRQYWQKAGVPDPPNPLFSTKYRFDSRNHQYRVRWESNNVRGAPAEWFNQVFSVSEIRPGVLRMAETHAGFMEYAYRIDGDEMTMELVNSTFNLDPGPSHATGVTTDEGTIVEEFDLPTGLPSVMVLTRSPAKR